MSKVIYCLAILLLAIIVNAGNINFALTSSQEHGTVATLDFSGDAKITAGTTLSFTYKNSPSNNCKWFDLDSSLNADAQVHESNTFCSIKSSSSDIAATIKIASNACEGFTITVNVDIEANVEIQCQLRLVLESTSDLIKDALTIKSQLNSDWVLAAEAVVPALKKLRFPDTASVTTVYSVQRTLSQTLDISTLDYTFSGEFPANAIIPLKLTLQIDDVDYKKVNFGLDTLADLIATRAYGRKHSCGTDIRLFFNAAANFHGYDAFLITGSNPKPSGVCSLPFSKAFLVAASIGGATEANPFGIGDFFTKSISIKTTFGETIPVTSSVDTGPFKFEQLKLVRGGILPTIIAGTFVNIIGYVNNNPTFKLIDVVGDGISIDSFRQDANAFYYAAVSGDSSGSSGAQVLDLKSSSSFNLDKVTNHAVYIGLRLPVLDALKISSFAVTFELDGNLQTIYHQPLWTLKSSASETKVEAVSNTQVKWSAKLVSTSLPSGSFTTKIALKPFIFPEIRTTSYQPTCTVSRLDKNNSAYENDDSGTAVEFKLSLSNFNTIDEVSRSYIEITGKHNAGDQLIVTCTHDIVAQGKLPLEQQQFFIYFQDRIKKYSISFKSFELETAPDAKWTEIQTVEPAIVLSIQSLAITSQTDYDKVLASAINQLKTAANTDGINLFAELTQADLLPFDFEHSFGVAYGGFASNFFDPFPGFSIDTLTAEGSYLRFGISKAFFGEKSIENIFVYSLAPEDDVSVIIAAASKFSNLEIIQDVTAETYYQVDGSKTSSYIPGLAVPIKGACYSSFQAPIGYFCQDNKIIPFNELDEDLVSGLTLGKMKSASAGTVLASAADGVKYAYLDVDIAADSASTSLPLFVSFISVILTLFYF